MKNDTDDRARALPRGRSLALLALFAAICALGLAACGSSGSSGSVTAAASTSTNAGTTEQGGRRGARFAALRACLQKYGITLPTPSAPPGGQGDGGPFRDRGNFKLPSGVTREQFMEDLKKCGAGFGRFGGFRGRLNNAATRAALTKYAACMREHGIALPAPNTSGTGPVFNTTGLSTTSTSFRNAEEACHGDLPAFFAGGRPPQAGPGANVVPPGGGAPGGVPPAGAPGAEG